MKRNKGFTLIELLVVVAIIGILASIVLASLNSARTKGKDAKIKSEMSSLRSAAEIYYSNCGNYGPNDFGTAVVAPPGSFPNPTTDCSAGVFSDSKSNMYGLVLTIATDAGGLSTSMYGASYSGRSWAVVAKLTSPNAGYLCVDSTGVPRTKNISGNAYTELTGTDSGSNYYAIPPTTSNTSICN